MAVVDKYSQTDLEAGNGKKFPALNGAGIDTVTIVGTASVLAADDNLSVYRIFPDVPSNYVPIAICIHNTAVTNGTDYDLGLYETNSGAVVDKDILADGITMADARTIATLNNVGMTTIDIADGTQSLATLSAQTNPSASYDIALTGNVVGTAAGTIRATGIFACI